MQRLRVFICLPLSPGNVIAVAEGSDQTCFFGGQFPHNLTLGATPNCFKLKERNISLLLPLSQGRKKFDSKGLSCKSPWGIVLERPLQQPFVNTLKKTKRHLNSLWSWPVRVVGDS